MGNRKERRRAALSTAGRRVKLDLFAEPSGESGGSLVNENEGGNRDSKHSAGSPKPSSSDEPTKNPLLLLGQYSDDEEDEESNGSPRVVSVQNSPKDLTGQVTETSNRISGDAATSTAEVYVTEKTKSSVSPDDTKAESETQDTTIAVPNLIHQNTALDHYKVTGSSDFQVIGDVCSGWKMVRHESTNQCYYWNVDTGETSWEVPQSVSQTDRMTTVQKLQSSSEGVSLCNPSGASESGFVAEDFVNSDHANTIPGSSETEPLNAYASSVGAYYSYPQTDGNVGGWNSLATSCSMLGQVADENVTVDDLSSRVVQFGEYLLEKLLSLKGSRSDSNGQEWISKYILEVEIRLADIKSLLSYGLALLPFWVHSEGKLRQLGEAFNHEASQLANTHNVEVNCVPKICNGSEKSTKTVESKKAEDLSSDTLNASIGIKSVEDINDYSTDGCVESVGTVKIHEDVNAERDVNDAGRSSKILPVTSNSPGCHAEDDMDMDVDMEVEEPTIPSCIAAMEPASQGSSVLHTCLVEGTELNIPHPPDEGWIPPPPPDEEMIPPPPPPDNESFPPPPDDPPGLSVQPPAYTNPYNAYAGYAYGYYDQTVAGVTPQAGVYYEVPNSYVTNAPVMANSGEHALYYNPQGIPVQAPQILNGAVTGLHFNSGLTTYSVLGENGLSCSENIVSNGVQNIDKRHDDASFVAATVQAQATISTLTNVSSRGTDSASVAKSTVSKGQSKASRVKTRTSSLASSMRSNKKVSSLVDKWKAAKEELQEDEDEDEDEPEDSYEALEKKRQREIEEWRAKVIASGEAKDNANFQPLGGDWRERIKRKRAQASSDAPQTSKDETTNGKQEPDLIKLAKDLPPGWQVHWDESSKKVYYSNNKTAETTWIRPAR